MQRRTLLGCAPLALLPLPPAWAISEADAASGLRTALARGAETAVAQLGAANGFMGNPLVKIELPGHLKSATKLFKATGQGAKLDDLVAAMNRAAETAMPEAKQLLVASVKQLSVKDGLAIVKGGDDAVTQFFASKTREPLTLKFLPIVTKACEKQTLAAKYNTVAAKAQGLGLVKAEDANIERYVTAQALDGLYKMIALEEKKIRQDPMASGSALLQKVFGR